MRIITSVFAVAVAIVAVVAPGSATLFAHADTRMVSPTVVQITDVAAPVLTFAPLANGVLIPGQDLVITGTVANPTSQPVPAGSATIVLGRDVMRTRSELSSWLDPTAGSGESPPGTAVLTAPTPEVPAGRTVPMQFTVPAASVDVGFQGSGWGPRTLSLRISAGGAEIGHAHSTIVWNPGTGVQTTRLSLVIALTVPQSSDGLIPIDLLAGYTADGGLLARQLDAVYDQPGISIAIDPRVLASIRVLGNSTPPSAKAWLLRLESATNSTFALSYADSDLAAASQAKAGGVLAPTSFPINPADFPGASTPPPTPSVSTSPTSPGANPVPPIPDPASLQSFDYTVPAVAWPASGTVVESDLDNFATGGLTTTILGSGNVGYGDLGYTPSAAALVGKHPVLVSDDGVSAYLNAAVQASTPAQWQEAISELSSAIALISLERPTSTRTILATFDRSQPGANARLAQTLAALAAMPWAASAPLSEVDAAFGSGSATVAASATLTAKPESAKRIATVAALLGSEATADSFASVLTDPTNITGERRLSLLALLSNAWTGDATWSGETKKYLTKSNVYVTKSVTIARSSATVFTSRNSPLPITVTNELPWPVTVYVSVRSPSNIITIDKNRVELGIEGQSQAKTTVPVTSNANGPVTLTVSLTSATNVQIATPTTIDVDVQAQWETAFTAVVAVLLVGVFGFGIYRNVAKRRRVKRAADGPDPVDPIEETNPAP